MVLKTSVVNATEIKGGDCEVTLKGKVFKGKMLKLSDDTHWLDNWEAENLGKEQSIMNTEDKENQIKKRKFDTMSSGDDLQIVEKSHSFELFEMENSTILPSLNFARDISSKWHQPITSIESFNAQSDYNGKKQCNQATQTLSQMSPTPNTDRLSNVEKQIRQITSVLSTLQNKLDKVLHNQESRQLVVLNNLEEKIEKELHHEKQLVTLSDLDIDLPMGSQEVPCQSSPVPASLPPPPPTFPITNPINNPYIPLTLPTSVFPNPMSMIATVGNVSGSSISTNMTSYAFDLVKSIFSSDVLKTSSLKGVRGCKKLDPQQVNWIKQRTMMKFSITEGQWLAVYEKLQTRLRNYRCKNDFKNSVAREVAKLYKHARSKLGRNILHLMTTKETITDDDINTELYPLLKDFGDVDEFDTRNNPMLTLLNYCLLANMKEMTILFIRYGKYKLAKILFAYKIFKRMNEYYVRHTPVEVKKVKMLLDSSESYFRDLAFKMLQKCSQKQELLTRRILLQRLHKFACKTCLNLAASVNHIEFVAADSCQVVLSDDVWFGKLVIPGSNYWLWRALKMVPCLLPPLYLLLRYKTDERERSEGKTETYIKNHSLQDESSCGTVWKKTKYFYTAPVIKCILNYSSYFAFLVLFTYVLTHKKHTNPSVVEWIIFTYCIAFVIEEVMQIVGAPIGHSLYQRFRYYWTLRSNILDWMALTLYFVAFGLRLNQGTINEAHILYAIDVSLWYFRLLKLFTLFPTIGPYIEMIVQMLVDLTHFLFVLAVFLLGYGIARFAILSPYNDSARLALDGIWTVPYRQIFADSLEESDVKVPKNTTAFGAEYSSVAVYIVEVLMGLYTLLSAILLINLLIARFSFTYGKVQDQSTIIWKFGRYYTLTEITDRSVLPPPFSILVNVYMLARWTSDYVRGIKDEETDLSADDIEELEGFQTACLDECLKDELSNTDESSETAKLGDVSMIHEVPFQNVQRQSQEVDSVDEKTKVELFHLPADVYYILSDKKRLPVADDEKAWNAPSPGYDENVTKEEKTVDVSLLEKNPLGRTGVTGKGRLSKYGANEITEAVVTRWKVSLSDVAEDRSGKKILQVLVERSNLLGVYALPMGNATADSLLPPVLADLLKVANLKDKTLWLEPERIALYEEEKNKIITNRKEIWKGTIEDARNTDEAWIESTVINFHDQDGNIIDKYLQSSYTKKLNLSWVDIDLCLPMRRRHMSYLSMLAKQCGAHF